MQAFNYLILPFVLCVLLVSTGCEDKRYKPAVWSSTTLPGKADEPNKAQSGAARQTPEKPTDWMTMVGKGGGKVKRRSTSLPVAANRGGTMPARTGTSLPARGTTMPARGISGTTMPARQQYQSGTTLPARKGTTLPTR